MIGGPLERETCRDVILPMLARSGWSEEQIVSQYRVAAGRTVSAGGVERDLDGGVVDYVLEIVPGLPVAVVEAKRRHRKAAVGVHQAKRYAQQLDVPLAYSSNGTEHREIDMLRGQEHVVESFRTPADVWSDYREQHGLDEAGAALLRRDVNRERRTAAGDVIEPRWYQRVAVHRVLCAIAAGERRVLLLMATGTGKTFTAMQIVQKLRAHAEITTPDRNYRVLYLADRDALLKQPMTKDFTPAFGTGPLHRVSGRSNTSREIYFATYQSLVGGGDEGDLFAQFRADFFDLVIVDECHRGSAQDSSSWRRVLDHFSAAVQLGLTATPKQDETADTYSYFGDPVFSYSLRQGIEDGYLAPYTVRRVVLSPDADGWHPEPGQLDALGREIPDGLYGTRDFERIVRLLARTDLVAEYLSRVLDRDPTARTIVFCVDQQHADDLRRALVNANPARVAADPEWVVRIVGSEEDRVRLLEDLSDPERSSPVVATTSRMLSTGVDVEDLRYVVIFRAVGSPVEFKQIVGRGTRLYPDKGKRSFEIIDFVGATAHFSDPDFDGYPVRVVVDPDGSSPEVHPDPEDPGPDSDPPSDPEVGEPTPDFEPGDPDGGDDGQVSPPDPTPRPGPYIVGDGFFTVVSESVQVPDTSTGRLVLTEYGEYVAGRVRRLAPTAVDLVDRWSRQPDREDVLAELAAADIEVGSLLGDRADDVDLLDVLLQLAWNVAPRTRAERARQARADHRTELEARSATAREVLSALLDRYAESGIDDVTSPEAVRVPPLSALGSPRDLARALGEGGLHSAVDEIQRWLYSSKTVS